MLLIGLVTSKYDAEHDHEIRIVSALINTRLDFCSSVFLTFFYNVSDVQYV